MTDLVISNGALINTISKNSEINLSDENEGNRNKNVVMKPQVSKEAVNKSPSMSNVENANILQDKTSTFNNSYVFHNQQPPVDSPMKPVENNVDISVNTKENLNTTQNEDKNKRLTILVNDSEDNLHNLVDKCTTNVIKAVDNEENSEEFLEEGKKQSKKLTMGSSSEDNIEDKITTNLIDNEENSATSVEEGKKHPTEKGTTSVIKAVDDGENSTTLTEKEKTQRKLLTIMDSDSDADLNIAEKDTVARVIGDGKNIEEGKKQRKRITIMDIDSDDDLNIAEKGATNVAKATNGKENIEERKKQRKQLTLIDSDSENDNNVNNSDEEDELTEEYGLIKDSEKKKQRNRLTVLNSDDSESENEERTMVHQESLHAPSTDEPLTEEIIEKQTLEISCEEKKVCVTNLPRKYY